MPRVRTRSPIDVAGSVLASWADREERYRAIARDPMPVQVVPGTVDLCTIDPRWVVVYHRPELVPCAIERPQ